MTWAYICIWIITLISHSFKKNEGVNEADGTERERETEVNRILRESGQGRGDRKNGEWESSLAGSAYAGDWREGLASLLLLCFHSTAFNKSHLGIRAGLDATGGHLIGLAMDKCSSQRETGAIAWWKPTLSADRLANIHSFVQLKPEKSPHHSKETIC